MAYWSLVLLVVSIPFLAYKNPQAMWNSLPPWLRSWTQSSAQNSKSSATEESGLDHEEKVKADAPSFEVSEPAQEDDEEGTPKASATEPKSKVPTFSLDGHGSSERESDSSPSEPETLSFPAVNSAQRASAMPPPSKPASQTPSSSLMSPPAPKPASLMPPPSRPNSLPNRNPAPSAGLRVPTTGPLPNRGPPASSQQRAGSSSKGRGKILLSPGHSPMDWAALANSSKNISGVPTLQRVTPSQLKTMTGRKGKPAWSSYQGKVYNITPYLPFHPGGEPELMKGAGRDGGKLFMEVHPWVNWEGMLSSCLVGILVSESEGHSTLDDMD